ARSQLLLRGLVLTVAVAIPSLGRGGAVPGALPTDPLELACPDSKAQCAVGARRLAVLQSYGALNRQGQLIAALQSEHVDAVLAALVATGVRKIGDTSLLLPASAH